MAMRTSEQVRASVEQQTEEHGRVVARQFYKKEFGGPIELSARVAEECPGAPAFADGLRAVESGGTQEAFSRGFRAELAKLHAAHGTKPKVAGAVIEGRDLHDLDPAEARWRAGQRELERLRESNTRITPASPYEMIAAEARPKPGESIAASIARRFERHKATCAVEGRVALGVLEFQKHDAVLNPELHQLLEAEREAPTRAKEQERSAVVAEVERRARQLMAAEPAKFKNKFGGAMLEVLQRDPALSARYKAAHLQHGKINTQDAAGAESA